MKKLLIVVDFQKDFVDGALPYPEAAGFLPRVDELIDTYERCDNDVIFTRDEHSKDYLHTEEGRNLPVPHCLEGSEGWAFCGDLEERAKKHLVFTKDTFGSSKMFDYLEKHSSEYSYIALVGLDLSICVLTNALLAKTACPNAHIVVDLSASWSSDAEAAHHAIEALRRVHVEVADFSKGKNGLL